MRFIEAVSPQIVGIDISLSALEKVARVYPYLFFQSNARELPFRNNSFDAVVVCGLLHHVVGYDDVLKYLLEFRRVLARDKFVILVEPNAYYPVQWLLGPLNRVVQKVKPGWRGLVPHEQPLPPRYLAG